MQRIADQNSVQFVATEANSEQQQRIAVLGMRYGVRGMGCGVRGSAMLTAA
ncbi:MAG: hypothetical protein R2806_22140 [Saprospiraceae bacterium]